MRQAIAYLRVSTDQQGENGIGLDAQLVQINAFAEAQGYRVTKVFREVASAVGPQSGKNRPELIAAEGLSRKTCRPILVANLSRISRNTEKLEQIIRDGRLRVISADLGENASEVVITGAAARAVFEGEQIGKRTKEALQARKAAGVLLGNRTNLDVAQRLGLERRQANADLRLDDFERTLSDAYRHGLSTPTEIAEHFNARKFVTARGKAWTPGNVSRALGKMNARDRLKAGGRQKPRPDAARSGEEPLFIDGKLTVEGAERVRVALRAKGMSSSEVESRMVKLSGAPADDTQAARLMDFVARVEREAR